jgi:hypothetical protein
LSPLREVRSACNVVEEQAWYFVIAVQEVFCVAKNLR